jgi:hypothetical protein
MTSGRIVTPPREYRCMTELPKPLAPAADVRQALRVDLQQFLTRDDVPPRTIGQIAEGDDLFSWTAQRLIDSVGGAARVEDLRDRPHVDETFDWTDIAESDRARVGELLRIISNDSPVPRSNGDPSVFEHIGLDKIRQRLPWCDPEYRTIALRIVRTLALDPTRPLDRRIKPKRLAAAIMWIALTASGAFARSRRIKPPMLWDWFEVSSCTNVGRELADYVRRRNGAVSSTDEVDLRDDQHAIGEITLGDPALLHSTYRQLLFEQRDDLLDRVKTDHERARDAHPIILNGMQERFGFRSRPATVRWAMRGANEETGRACVSVAFGEGLDDMEVLGLSVPDARRLIEALQHALDAPIAA